MSSSKSRLVSVTYADQKAWGITHKAPPCAAAVRQSPSCARMHKAEPYATLVSILAPVWKKTATNARMASAPPAEPNQNAVQLCVTAPPLLVVKKSSDPPESSDPMNMPIP